MSSPGVWILFPGLVAGALYLLRRWERAINLLGILIAMALAWLAWKLPIGQPISLAPLPGLSALELRDTLTFLGRRFILVDSARPVLILIYLGIALWFGGAYIARTNRLFIPLGLGMAALLTAALSVEPFLFAALLIEMAALVSIPFLSPPGKRVGRGAIRFLTFQTLGMPFILITGWLLSEIQTTPTDPGVVLRTTFLMVLGFAFLAGIFPFHTWIPMLAEEAHPYAAAFVLFLLPGVTTLFALEFFNRYIWLRSEPEVYVVLRSLGILMVVTGGIWAAFQRNLGRMMGYAVTVEIGRSLLALSLGAGSTNSTVALGIFFALLLPRGIALALWALALATLKTRSEDLSFRAVQGMGRSMPLAVASLLLAHFSLAGLPLLAGFPVHLALWTALSEQSLPIASLALLGSAGLLAGGIRTLAVLVMGTGEEQWHISEDRAQLTLLGLGWVILFLMGLLPQWFLPMLTSIANVFGSPVP